MLIPQEEEDFKGHSGIQLLSMSLGIVDVISYYALALSKSR